MKTKKKPMATHLPVSHHNKTSSSAPNRLQSRLYQKVIPVIFIILGALLFLCVNLLAYYYGWKMANNEPNTAIQMIQKTAEMFEKQTGYTIMPVQNEVAPGRNAETYACDPNGVCNTYANPASMGCPKTFSDPYCSNACGDPKVQCTY